MIIKSKLHYDIMYPTKLWRKIHRDLS